MSDGIVATEIDGIPTVLAPRSGGRIAAGLFFRVGRADETLATTGITHLVEHLALHDHGLSDLHYNGATADNLTLFHVEGSAAHVVEYLNGVCSALRSLPLHRLETEKEILRTEASGRSGGPAPRMAMLRHGARGYGLSSYLELGLPRLDAETVVAWTREHFTRDNAVLWITADAVPDGLALGLPEGRRTPLPKVTSALDETPAWFHGPGDPVVFNAVVDRSTAASLYTQVLSKALWHDLRQQGGYSYTAAADYLPRDRDHATITAMADHLPEKTSAVIGGFVDVLARLRAGTIAEAELESARSAARHAFDGHDLAAARLPGHAANLLLGHRNLSLDELEAQIAATTVADLQRVAEEAHATALMQVPALGLDWAGFTQAPEVSTRAVQGRAFPSREKDGTAVVIGRDGVSLTFPDGRATVLYADVVAMQTYPDGGRRITGGDGFSVSIEPTIHPVDDHALRSLDTRVDHSVVVPMPARDASRIPQPEVARAQTGDTGARASSAPAAGPRGVVGSALAAVGFWSLVLLTAFLVLVSIESLTPSARAEEGGVVAAALICGATGFSAWRTFRMWRNRRARRS